MKIYFIHDGQQQRGPFDLEELKDKGIYSNTPVWKRGEPQWLKAEEIIEIRNIISSSPPPFKNVTPNYENQNSNYTDFKPPYNSPYEKAGFKIGRALGLTGLLAIVLIIGAIIYHKQSTSYNPYPYAKMVEDPEHAFPENYLRATGTYTTNIWGNKMILEGDVNNSSNHTNYKDIILKATFYSITKAVIETKNYTLYDYISYGGIKHFKFKVNKPKETISCGIEVVRGTFY